MIPIILLGMASVALRDTEHNYGCTNEVYEKNSSGNKKKQSMKLKKSEVGLDRKKSVFVYFLIDECEMKLYGKDRKVKQIFQMSGDWPRITWEDRIEELGEQHGIKMAEMK